jgi:hypothetical protein
MTPFEEFFEWFTAAMERVSSEEPVFSNGHKIQEASWDRKAAYVCWLAVNGEPPP